MSQLILNEGKCYMSVFYVPDINVYEIQEFYVHDNNVSLYIRWINSHKPLYTTAW